MRSFWPLWATAQNPVFRYEIGRWRRSRFRRYLQPAAWSVVLFFFLVFICLPAACAGLLAFAPSSRVLQVSDSRLSDFFAASVLFLLASGALSGLANGLLGVVSSALAATLIAREREAQTWPLMRLTTLTPGQIVGGKLAAFLYILQSSMHLVVFWRGLTVLAGLGAGVLFILLAPELKSVLAELRSIAPGDAGLTLAGLVLVGLISAAYWLLEPYFTVVYNGAVGLAVSTFARTRRWAIALVFITQFTLGLVLYWPIQQIAALLPFAFVSFLLLLNPRSAIDPTAWTLPTIGMQYVVVMVLQTGVLAACLVTALYRAERLSD
jgi:MFS family permease